MEEAPLQLARNDKNSQLGVARIGRATLRTLLLVAFAIPLLIVKTIVEKRREVASHLSVRGDGEDGPALSEVESPIAVFPLSEILRSRRESSSRQAGSSDSLFMLVNRLPYPVKLLGGAFSSLVPTVDGYEGVAYLDGMFITDFASIPPLLMPIAGRPTGRHARAALVHDWLYAWHPDRSSEGRRACDQAMVSIMAYDNVGSARRAIVYLGLRLGGGPAFRGAPKRRIAYMDLTTSQEARIKEAFRQLKVYLNEIV